MWVAKLFKIRRTILVSIPLRERALSLALVADTATHFRMVLKVRIAPLRQIRQQPLGREPRKKCCLRSYGPWREVR